MAVYDTEENGRSEYTKRTLDSLKQTVDFNKHRLFLVLNRCCDLTVNFVIEWSNLMKDNNGYTLVFLQKNVGTARAVNMGIRMLKPGENVIKIDNDVVINSSGWVEEMEEVIARDPSIGIVGLKRKDLRQTPYDVDPQFRSELRQLPHEPGERWIVVEETNDIMGTCTMLSSALIDKVGGYMQYGVYGFDDTLMNLRAGLAGFRKCFLPHIDIDHIDTGEGIYSIEKQQLAAIAWPEYHKLHAAYCDGSRPLFEEI